MKKVLSVLLASLMAVTMMVSCSDDGQSSQNSSSSQSSTEESSVTAEDDSSSSEEASVPEKTDATMNIAVLKGPTGLGALELMKKDEDGTSLVDYNFTIVGQPDEIVSKIATGELDVAAVPSNLASTLYHKTDGGVQMLAVNTLGVLYLVTKNAEITSMDQLRGMNIISSGQNSTSQYVLEYLLAEAGLTVGEDVTVEYKSEHAEAVSALAAQESGVAVLPQPFVTTATTQNPDIKIALDLSAEWERLTESKLTMGAIIARKDYIEANPDAIDAFLYEYALSTTYTNENPADAAALSEKYDIIAAAVAEKAIPYCNITYIDGEEMKTDITAFLEVLLTINPQSIGGSIPDDDFFYQK